MRSRSILLCGALLLVGCGGRSSPLSTLAPAPDSTSAISVDGPAHATTTAVRCQPGSAGTGVVTRSVAYESIAGVDPVLTSLDIYPTSGPCSAAVVVWVHGGGYVNGDKSNQVADKVTLFNRSGWLFVSVNYRLSTGGPGSAQFPDHYSDVAAAIGWVHDHITDYGGDPSRIAVLGHSAGADIVSNVVVDPTYLAAHGMSLSDIACAAPLDTEGFDKPAATTDDPDAEAEQWRNALGNNPDYLAVTSASLSIAPNIGIPPMIGVVRGTAERRRIETDFLARLTDAGIAATTIDASSLSHADVSRRIGAPGDDVMTPPLMQFLATCLSP